VQLLTDSTSALCAPHNVGSLLPGGRGALRQMNAMTAARSRQAKDPVGLNRRSGGGALWGLNREGAAMWHQGCDQTGATSRAELPQSPRGEGVGDGVSTWACDAKGGRLAGLGVASGSARMASVPRRASCGARVLVHGGGSSGQARRPPRQRCGPQGLDADHPPAPGPAPACGWLPTIRWRRCCPGWLSCR